MNMSSTYHVPAPAPPPTQFVNNTNNQKMTIVSFSAQFEDEQSAMKFAKIILSVMQNHND